MSLSKRFFFVIENQKQFVVVDNLLNFKQSFVVDGFNFEKFFVVENQKQFVVADNFISKQFFVVENQKQFIVIDAFNFEKFFAIVFSTSLTTFDQQKFVVVISRNFFATFFINVNDSKSSSIRLLK